MSIALAAFSVVCLVLFLAFAVPAYKKREKESFSITNHFCFEILPLKENPTFIPLLIPISLYLLSFVGNFIYFAITDYGPMNVIIAFISVLIAFSIGVLFFLPLSKLRERCFFSIIFIVLVAVINALLAYEATIYRNMYLNNLAYVAFGLNGFILLFSLVVIFLPKLFDFSLKKNEDGTTERKGFYLLAFYEWLLIMIVPLTQVSIIIMEIIKKQGS